MANHTPVPQCPICNAMLAEGSQCLQCQTDLREYLTVFYAPDVLWNLAAEAVARADFRTAYDHLAAAHFLRPQDTDILVEMAHCAEANGDIVCAMEKLALAMQEDADPAIVEDFQRLADMLERQRAGERQALNAAAMRQVVEGLQILMRDALPEDAGNPSYP